MRNFLAEATELKHTHIPHLEDTIFAGAQGTDFALSVLKELGNVLHSGGKSDAMTVTVKWDGAPAIIFGPDPLTGQFFVSTKSAFNKVPKLAHTHEEVDALFPDSIRAIMHSALDALPHLHPMLVCQADVLFTAETLQQSGLGRITFRPNTITYSCMRGTEFGKQVLNAKLGIVLHTIYVGTGTALADYSAMPISAETFAALRIPDDVLVINANLDTVSGTVAFDEEEYGDYLLTFETAIELSNEVPGYVYEMVGQDPLQTELSRFINHSVREGVTITKSKGFADNFILYLDSRKEDEQAKRSTQAGKNGVLARYIEMIDEVLDAGPGFRVWCGLHIALTRAKTLVIRKLERAPSDVIPYIGSTMTGPEGFVVHAANKVVKLVDRLEFSHANFTLPRTF